MQTWRINSPDSELRSWQNGLAEAFVRLDAESLGASDFRGKIEQASLSHGQVSRVRATSHRVLRRKEHVAARRRDVVFVNLQVSGRGSINMPGLSFKAAPMDLSIVPTSDVYSIAHEAPFELISIALPQESIPENLEPGLKRLSQSAAGRELAGVLAGLSSLAMRLPDGTATLEYQIESMLALVGSIANKETGDDAMRNAILAHIARRHSQHGLSASPLAAAFGLSERQLHTLFEPTGLTIGRRIEIARLETACNLLKTTNLPVSNVALRSGFRDPSYFSRVFRRKFGVSPRDWRVGE
ncbi:MAG: AraC family transcriptional regulator [Pseudomonadota bacterium]